MEISNYLPFSRQIFKHEFWSEERIFSRFEAWTDLLQTARYEEAETRKLIGNSVVRWGRGELVASLRFLAERWGWSKNKVDSFIKLLISEKMISKRTADGTQITVFSIVKYDTFNPNCKIKNTEKGHEKDDPGTPPGHDRDKTNKDNTVKKVNIDINNIVGLAAPTTTTDVSFSERCKVFVDKFNQKRGTKFRVTAKVSSELKFRLKNYNPLQILNALDKAIKDEFHVENNFKYLTPEYLLREKVLERYINIVENTKPNAVFTPGTVKIDHRNRQQ